MIDVYDHKEQRCCNESLRLVGGRSPGSQVLATRPPPPPPEPWTTKNSSSSRAPKKSTGATCRLLKVSAKYKQGAHRSIVRVSEEKLLGGRSINCAHFSMPLVNNRREHSARWTNTSKTSTIHATAVVDEVRVHFGEEQDENRPREASLPNHVENMEFSKSHPRADAE